MVDILGLATALRAATTIIKFVFVFVFDKQDSDSSGSRSLRTEPVPLMLRRKRGSSGITNNEHEDSATAH